MLICTHHTGEPHALLGPQAAATYLSKCLDVPTMVVGLTREFNRDAFLAYVEEHYRGSERIIGFSHLSGRKDLFELITVLHDEGYTTVLGGPQALQDYRGEPDADRFPHRFGGLRDRIDISVQGPVDGLLREHLSKKASVIESAWKTDLYMDVDWSNICTFSDKAEPLEVRVAQVLSAIGCPYAQKETSVLLDPPASLAGRAPQLPVRSCGCIFCDVAWDKGYKGHLSMASILAQVRALPENEGRKIAFELVDEYPIPTLQRLLAAAHEERLELSQVNLVCRVDAVTQNAESLRTLLNTARERGLQIMFSSIGFESFSDKILSYFNKGVTVAESIKCVELLRDLKDDFGDTLLYRRDEGATHGFIHPTPWDDAETFPEMDRNIVINGIYEDILPDHSTPLITHHGSALGEWLRQLEERTGVVFGREGTWIEWWNHTEPPPSS